MDRGATSGRLVIRAYLWTFESASGGRVRGRVSRDGFCAGFAGTATRYRRRAGAPCEGSASADLYRHDPAGRDRTGAGGKSSHAAPIHSQRGGEILREIRQASGRRRPRVASVLRKRLLGRRIHARRRPVFLRQPLQHARLPRQLDHQELQAHRGRVPGATNLQPSRESLGDRRLARGD